jgi:hypothetical protein
LADPARLGRIDHAWGTELTGFGRPFGLATDLTGRLLVADMDLHRIFRFDRGLAAVEWTGGRGWAETQPLAPSALPRTSPNPPGLLDGPHSVDVAEGSLVVCCYYTPALAVLGADGVRVDVLGRGRLAGPATALFDPTGRLLVADYGANAILAFARDGRFLTALGGAGAFDRPHMARGLADGTVLVADTWNHRIQRFTSGGDWFGWIGDGVAGWSTDRRAAKPGAGSGDLHAPVAIDRRGDGLLLVTDWGNDRLLLFDADGTAHGPAHLPVALAKPYDARFHGAGLVIADSHNSRVLVIDRLG